MGKRRAPTIRAKPSSRRSKLRPRPTAPRKKTSNQEDTSTQDSSSRDWSDLSDGPTSLIASHILTGGDVADYIRFRTICRSWRVSCPSPLTHPILDDSRLHPRQWIMLLGDDDEKLTAAGAPHRTRRGFLHVSTGQCVHVDIPELHDHGVLRSFYGIVSDSVVVVDNTTTGKLVVAAKLATSIRRMMNDTAHLVELAGELMLVHLKTRRVRGPRGEFNAFKTTCKLYRVNMATGKVTPASARGRAIFVGGRRALAVSPQVFPSLSGYTVYVGFNVGGFGRRISAYNLRDGSSETFDYRKSGMVHPWSIADCLAAYVSG
ncbi:hypothetical protein HU200_046500 [Digitaria exilis]|uniref:KIB1-4 beta-propeller domain-containing protein n=1 Tax=Digitaria exilis TaxID=1010633 RepID=A0A835AVF9_9POAL|nr:hypothetical protein HU200_046500 [Digitaria exilis]CAB3445578.1 unnamed protein product [Digitaria exilis]